MVTVFHSFLKPNSSSSSSRVAFASVSGLIRVSNGFKVLSFIFWLGIIVVLFFGRKI
jgi:hypothetical protein